MIVVFFPADFKSAAKAAIGCAFKLCFFVVLMSIGGDSRFDDGINTFFKRMSNVCRECLASVVGAHVEVLGKAGILRRSSLDVALSEGRNVGMVKRLTRISRRLKRQFSKKMITKLPVLQY